jgi:hypothetical protein
VYAGAEIEFDVRVPVDDDGLRANVAANLARGLPEVPAYTPTSDLITIVANGPTARQCALAGATLALNGSIRLFNERGAHLLGRLRSAAAHGGLPHRSAEVHHLPRGV